MVTSAKEITLHLCLFFNWITLKFTNQNFMKLYGMVGHNPGTNRLDFE